MLCNEDFITTWSLQSNTTPNSKNVWNNVGGKESDDAIIFTDRSDSGVTSPHSHHHIDDRINVISPCDLNLLDHMTNEDLRRRLSQIIKKPNIDEEDKICLQQVLAFVQNLDAMSHGHDSLPSSEESSSLEYIKSRVSDYSSSSRSSSDICPTLQLQTNKPKSSPSQGRIVATVLPYSSTVSTPNDSPQRKLRAWHTTSLTESGVFEGDLSETSVYTQTDPEEFSNLSLSEPTEAQKLNRIREQFEECAKKSAFTKVPVTSSQSLSPNFSDQKRLQYYKDRLEVLEGKLLIYESSGDRQAKLLADRLQREIVLENLVKELQDRVDFLEVENSEIEEEKCEFEEAENDTRLRLQRLEVELEILSQRNIELEMSREALQNKLKDCRSESAILRDDLSAVQTQVCHLEEDRCRFKENFEFLHSILPALVLYNAYCVANYKMGNCIERDLSQPDLTRHDEVGRMSSDCDCAEAEDIYRREIANLRGEIRSLKRQINDLNSRHSEAMACADGCWEDLEKSYNDRLMASKSKEESLQKKIKQLEDCLHDDSRAANEKICQLEDAEKELRMCLQKVSRDQRKTLQEHGLITEEYHRLKEKYEKLVEQVDGPIKDALDREKTQNKNLKDELGYIRRINCEQDMHYRNELDCFQVQMDKLQKELLQIQVTNSELREEVCTLEKEVLSLHQAKKEDLDKIRCLSDEVRTKEEMCDMLEKRVEKLLSGSYYRQRQQAQAVDRQMSASFSGAVSLAQELNGSPVKRLRIEEPVDLKTAAKNLGSVLGTMKESARTIPSHREFQNVANDVKKLAESILANKSELVIQNFVETAENLMTTFEGTMRKSLDRFRKAVADLNVPKNSNFLEDQDEFHSSGCEFCGNQSERSRFNVAVDPIVVTVPLTLYITPKVGQDFLPQKPFPMTFVRHPIGIDGRPESFETRVGNDKRTGFGPRRDYFVEPSMIDESTKTASAYSLDFGVLSDEVEPIRTASISIADGHLSQVSCGLPKVIRFSEDTSQLEEDQGSISSELLPEVSKTSQAEKEDSIDRSRTTTTQNDRYRDHTNLSHEPNIEAPAGQCPIKQQQRQTYQAKDNNDDNDGNEQNNERKLESSLETYFTPSGSCLCSNDDGFNNFASSSSEAAASSIVKLSFSTTEKGLQGSYECICTEKGDKGSCHKFWCQSSKDLGNNKKKLIGAEEKNEKTDYEGVGVGKNLLVSCMNEEQSERSSRNEPISSSKALFHTEQKGLVELFEHSQPGIFQKSENSSKYFYKGSEGRLSNNSNTEDLCPSEDFERSKKEEVEKSKYSKSSGAIITPRDYQQTMNEDVIPLLKSIYNVLQTMRDEKLHLGSTAIHLDEPFNALPSPPPVPPSSSKYRKQLLRSSRQDLHLFKEEPINIEDNLTVLEPPERDVEDYQQSSTASQRLIPVDMNLLRTDEELIWEPDSNSNNNQSLKAQFRQFPEKLVEELQVRQSGSSLTRSSTLKTDLCDKPPQLPEENSEIFAGKPSNTQNSTENTVLTPILKKSSHQKLESNQKDEEERLQLKTQASQAVQVNLMSSHSAQFLIFDNTLEEQDLSEEKLLKTSKEILLPTSVDIGTDCPDFDNIHRTSSNQEPSKPQDHEMTNFIESILLDLKAMENARNTSFSRLPCPSPVVWQKPSKDLSYPATIETVQELGANSLFVKWRVQNLGNIGGYELFLDGNLTNRYFNCIHRAAVICDVNLQCPHRITLRAQPLLPPRTTISLTKNNSSCLSSLNKKSSTTHPEASCPQLDGSVWYPSVYHFEPNSLSAPQNAVLY